VRSLKAGGAKARITPALGTRLQGHITRSGPATSVLDELYCRVIAFEAGDARALIGVCDLLEFRQDFVDELKGELERRFSLPGHSCLLCATHTHTGPPTIDLGDLTPDLDYLSRLRGWIVSAAEEAFGSLEPVRLRFASLPDASIGVNRRLLTAEGVRMAPNPAGPLDPEASVLAFERPDGTPVAALVHHAVHPTTLGVMLHVISADYPGRACRFLECSLGGELTVLFVQGACGDVRPAVVDRKGNFREGREEDINRLGRRLGSAFLKGWKRGAALEARSLSARLRRVELPFGPLPTLAELENEHERCLRLVEQAERNAAGHEDGPGLPGVRDAWEQGHMDQRALNLAVAAWAEAMIGKARAGALPRGVTAGIQALAFGRELVLIGFPGELFSEIGMRIKQRSPFRHTVLCGYAGATVGYVPTRSALAEGGYEVSEAYKLYGLPCAFREDVEDLIYGEVSSLLADLYRESES
jgi:hypothetical protein